jgi:hypothetical protein
MYTKSITKVSDIENVSVLYTLDVIEAFRTMSEKGLIDDLSDEAIECLCNDGMQVHQMMKCVNDIAKQLSDSEFIRENMDQYNDGIISVIMMNMLKDNANGAGSAFLSWTCSMFNLYEALVRKILHHNFMDPDVRKKITEIKNVTNMNMNDIMRDALDLYIIQNHKLFSNQVRTFDGRDMMDIYGDEYLEDDYVDDWDETDVNFNADIDDINRMSNTSLISIVNTDDDCADDGFEEKEKELEKIIAIGTLNELSEQDVNESNAGADQLRAIKKALKKETTTKDTKKSAKKNSKSKK